MLKNHRRIRSIGELGKNQIAQIKQGYIFHKQLVSLLSRVFYKTIFIYLLSALKNTLWKRSEGSMLASPPHPVTFTIKIMYCNKFWVANSLSKPLLFTIRHINKNRYLGRSHSQNQIPPIPLPPLFLPSAVKVALPKVVVQGALLINLPRVKWYAVLLFDEAKNLRVSYLLGTSKTYNLYS